MTQKPARRFSGLLLCLCAFTSLLNIAYAESPAKPSITVSTNNTPLDKAVLEEVSTEVLQRLGYEFVLKKLPSERSLRFADTGKIDGEGLRVAGLSEKYFNLVQIEEPYVRISFSAFSKDPNIQLSGWESLKDYRVAFITGWKMFEAKAKDAKKVIKVDTPEQIFQMLDSGRVDLALYTKADGLSLLRQQQRQDIQPLEPALKEVDLYLYLHKRHSDLAKQMASTLKTLKQEGRYQAIVADIYAR